MKKSDSVFRNTPIRETSESHQISLKKSKHRARQLDTSPFMCFVQLKLLKLVRKLSFGWTTAFIKKKQQKNLKNFRSELKTSLETVKTLKSYPILLFIAKRQFFKNDFLNFLKSFCQKSISGFKKLNCSKRSQRRSDFY